MKELTGAKVAIGEKDVDTVEHGTALTCAGYYYGMFETLEVDCPLKHLDTIDLANTVIKCHHTPGQTPSSQAVLVELIR